MRRVSSRFIVLLVCCFATRAEAEPITYQFIQTGSNLPGFVATASLTFADGTFNLPTIACRGLGDPNCVEPLDFGNLSALTAHVESDVSWPDTAEFNFTLADFHVPKPPPPNDYSFWCIGCLSPFAGVYVMFGDVNAQHVLRLTSTNVFFDTDYLVFCPNGGHCVATGYWEPELQPIPEPATAILLLSGIAVAASRRRFVHWRH